MRPILRVHGAYGPHGSRDQARFAKCCPATAAAPKFNLELSPSSQYDTFPSLHPNEVRIAVGILHREPECAIVKRRSLGVNWPHSL